MTDRGVVFAGGVVEERLGTYRSVKVAGVEYECLSTDGRVVAARCVVVERVKTDCRVQDATCEAKERIFTLDGVEAQAGILTNRSRLRRKGKAGEDERDENWQNGCVLELSQSNHGF